MVKKSERRDKTVMESRVETAEKTGLTGLDAAMYVRAAPDLWEEFTALAEHEQEAVMNEARQAVIQ